MQSFVKWHEMQMNLKTKLKIKFYKSNNKMYTIKKYKENYKLFVYTYIILYMQIQLQVGI